MGGQNGLWGMGDHTRPVGAFELMMHIRDFPSSRRIPAGRTSDLLVSNYDFMPTVPSYLGWAASCRSGRNHPAAISPPRCGDNRAPGKTSCSTRWSRRAACAASAGSTWRVFRRSLELTTCRPIRRSGSICTASPAWRTCALKWPSVWMPSSASTLIRSTTCGTGDARKQNAWITVQSR